MNRQIPPSLPGVIAALPTPFDADGVPAIERLYPIVDFLLERQIKGFCIGGATGEYAACGVADRIRLFRSIASRVDHKASLILGVGAEHAAHVSQLAHAAADCGAAAVLLPPPCFFRFDPSDLVDFLQKLGAELPLPVLLYNIPQFTQDLGIRNMLRLMDLAPNIIGLKDSSGCRENFLPIREVKSKGSMVFFIGSDELFLQALQQGADGAISGTATACPELVLAAYDAHVSGQGANAELLQKLIEEFCSHGSDFPPPWAIKLALNTRGFDTGGLNWQVGNRMRVRVHDFQEWFASWVRNWPAAGVPLGSFSLPGSKQDGLY